MLKKIIVKLRMWYADLRGHHGKRWNYEPGDWYILIIRYSLIYIFLHLSFIGYVE
jgi:hypothetical protein